MRRFPLPRLASAATFLLGALLPEAARAWSWGDVLLHPSRLRGEPVDWPAVYRGTELLPLPEGGGYADVATLAEEPWKRVWIVPPSAPGARSRGSSLRARGRVVSLLADEGGYLVLVEREAPLDRSVLPTASAEDYERAVAERSTRPRPAGAEPAPSPVAPPREAQERRPSPKPVAKAPPPRSAPPARKKPPPPRTPAPPPKEVARAEAPPEAAGSAPAAAAAPDPAREAPELSEVDMRRNASGLAWKEESFTGRVKRGCSLRAGPGTSFKPMPDDVELAVVRVEGSRGTWFRVRRGELSGWVYRTCLDRVTTRR